MALAVVVFAAGLENAATAAQHTQTDLKTDRAQARDLRAFERAADGWVSGTQRPDPEALRALLRPLVAMAGERGRRLETALCRLLGAAQQRSLDAHAFGAADVARATLLTRLVDPANDGTRIHLERGVLLRPVTQDDAGRLGAALALGGARLDGGAGRGSGASVPALLAASRDPDPRVARAALDGLVGEPHATARFAAEVLARGEEPEAQNARRRSAEGEGGMDVALARLGRHARALEHVRALAAAEAAAEAAAATSAPPRPPAAEGSPAPGLQEPQKATSNGARDAAAPGREPPSGLPAVMHERLVPALIAELRGDDWQRAAHAAKAADLLEPRPVVRPLIEALEVWIAREAEALREPIPGAGRVRAELVETLERISGLSLGARPDRWRQWLAGVENGEPVSRGADATRAQSGFFGLELRSSAVVFVLDGSGSMGVVMPGQGTQSLDGPRGPSRFGAAAAQVLGALDRRDGPIWFQVVVFNSHARRFASGARRADPERLKVLRGWLEAQEPAGGTRLGAGLDEIWPTGPATSRWRPDFDTVVVLCDGQTEEGADSMRAFLADGPLEHGIVFHAVQIGGGAAPALKALVAGTGGRFVRVPAQ